MKRRLPKPIPLPYLTAVLDTPLNRQDSQAQSLAEPQGRLARLGQISFINCLPVALPIERGVINLPATITYASPQELNACYAKGDLDLGAMSSYYYLSAGNLDVIPEISISCRGPVGSVLFFSKGDIDQRAITVSVPQSSATSVNLLKVLLAESYGVKVETIVDGKPDAERDDIDGALVIGDRAIEVDERWSMRYKRFDLGDWWNQLIGLPMVFGMWAALPAFSRANCLQFQAIGQSLKDACQLGTTSLLNEVIACARQRTGFSEDRLMKYYTQELDFQLTESHLAGLAEFRRLLLRHGLL